MNLIHRNRVEDSRFEHLELSPLRSPFPSVEGLFGASVLIDRLFLGYLDEPCPAVGRYLQTNWSAAEHISQSETATRLRWMRCPRGRAFTTYGRAT